MKLSDLKPNKRNPRRISKQKKEWLLKGMKKFGDLGGIVWNKTTGNLISGHQRVATAGKDARVSGNFLVIGSGADEQTFPIRVVEWDEAMEAEAMLVANGKAGEWDMDRLKVLAADFPRIDFELAGFPELAPLAPLSAAGGAEGGGEEPSEKYVSDEQYVRDTPQTEERIGTISEEMNAANPIAEIQETQSKHMESKQFVIIINCYSAERKKSLKEKIAEVVEAEGGKFF